MNTFQSIVALTVNQSNAGVALGTVSSYSTTAVSAAVINGLFGVALTAQTNAASPVVDAVTLLPFVPLTANQTTVLVWGVNVAGAIQLMQGNILPTETGIGAAPGAFINAPQFPVIPDAICPIAYAVVRTSPTGAAFTAGTTAWAAAGITTSVPRNVHSLPTRPVIS